jgi:prepilin-type N-terminal cleavage/methylation domain-containing protein
MALIEERLKNTNRDGFTIFELVVVVTIIAVVGSLAAPSLIQSRRMAKLRDASFTLVANLQRAKAIAIRDRTTVDVDFSASGYAITTLGNTDLPAGVVILLGSSVLDGNSTGFNSRGTRSDTGITDQRIVIENLSGTQRIIEINRLGLVEVQG